MGNTLALQIPSLDSILAELDEGGGGGSGGGGVDGAPAEGGGGGGGGGGYGSAKKSVVQNSAVGEAFGRGVAVSFEASLGTGKFLKTLKCTCESRAHVVGLNADMDLAVRRLVSSPSSSTMSGAQGGAQKSPLAQKSTPLSFGHSSTTILPSPVSADGFLLSDNAAAAAAGSSSSGAPGGGNGGGGGGAGSAKMANGDNGTLGSQEAQLEHDPIIVKVYIKPWAISTNGMASAAAANALSTAALPSAAARATAPAAPQQGALSAAAAAATSLVTGTSPGARLNAALQTEAAAAAAEAAAAAAAAASTTSSRNDKSASAPIAPSNGSNAGNNATNAKHAQRSAPSQPAFDAYPGAASAAAAAAAASGSLTLQARAIARENEALQGALHALPFARAVETDKAGYLIREYCWNNLHDRLSAKPTLDSNEKLWFVYQMLLAVADAHERGVCHGDVKLENFVCTTSNWCYLTDFAAAYKPLRVPDDNPSVFSFFFDASARRVGSIAPERFASHAHGTSAATSGGAARIAAAASKSDATAAATSARKPFGERRDVDADTLDVESMKKTVFAEAALDNDERARLLTRALPTELHESMDVFSLGCAIAEWLCDGAPLFTYSQLLQWRSDCLEVASEGRLKLSTSGGGGVDSSASKSVAGVTGNNDTTDKDDDDDDDNDDESSASSAPVTEAMANSFLPPHLERIEDAHLFALLAKMTHFDATKRCSAREAIEIFLKHPSVNGMAAVHDEISELHALPSIESRLRWIETRFERIKYAASGGAGDVEAGAKSATKRSDASNAIVDNNGDAVDATGEHDDNGSGDDDDDDGEAREPYHWRLYWHDPRIFSNSAKSASQMAAASMRRKVARDTAKAREPTHVNVHHLLPWLLSSVRCAPLPSQRVRCLRLFTASPAFTRTERLHRMLPYTVALLDDPAALTRMWAIRTLATVMDGLQDVPATDASVFSEYILPALASTVTAEPIEFVAATVVECLPRLAKSAHRTLERSRIVQDNAARHAAAVGSSGGGGGDASAAREASGGAALISGASNDTWQEELERLRTLVYELLVDVLAAHPESALLRRAVFADIASLSLFFGKEKTIDLIVPLAITFLNDRDWQVRLAFFKSIVPIGFQVGPEAVDAYLVECILQKLTDEEIFVSERALRALAGLIELNLLGGRRLVQVAERVAPLLKSSSLWIRHATVAVVAAVLRSAQLVDIYALFEPIFGPYFSTSLVISPAPDALLLLDTLRGNGDDAEAAAGSVSSSGRASMHHLNGVRAAVNAIEAGNDNGNVNKDVVVRTLQMSDDDDLKDFVQVASGTELSAAGKLKPPAITQRFNMDLQAAFDHELYENLSQHFPIYEDNSSSVCGNLLVTGGASPPRSPRATAAAAAPPQSPSKSQSGVSESAQWRRAMEDKIRKKQARASGGETSAPQSLASSGVIGRADTDDSDASNATRITRSESHAPTMAGRGGSSSASRKANKALSKSLRNADRSTASSASGGGSVAQSAVHLPSPVKGQSPGYYQHDATTVVDVNGDGARTSYAVSASPRTAPAYGGRLVAHFHEHSLRVNELAAANDMSFFASAGDDGLVKIWDSHRLQQNVANRSRLTYGAQGGRVTSICVCEDKESVASASSNGSLQVLRVERVPSNANTAQGPTYTGIQVLSDSVAQTRANSASALHSSANEGESARGSPLPLTLVRAMSSRVLLHGNALGELVGYDTRIGGDILCLRNRPQFGSPTSLVLDPERNWAFVGTHRGYMTLWDLRFHIPLLCWKHPSGAGIRHLVQGSAPSMPGGVGGARGGSGAAASVSPNQHAFVYAASSLVNNEVDLWNVETGECVQLLRSASRRAPRDSLRAILPERLSRGPQSALFVDPLFDSARNDVVSGLGSQQQAATEGSSAAVATAGVEAAHITSLARVPRTALVIAGSSDRRLRCFNVREPKRSYTIGSLGVPYNALYTRAGFSVVQELDPRALEGDADGGGDNGDGAANDADGGGRASSEFSTRHALKPVSPHHADTITALLPLSLSTPMLCSASRDGVIKIWQ